MTSATLAAISIVAGIAVVVALNLAYRRYLRSLAPRERKKEDDDTTDFLQKW